MQNPQNSRVSQKSYLQTCALRYIANLFSHISATLSHSRILTVKIVLIGGVKRQLLCVTCLLTAYLGLGGVSVHLGFAGIGAVAGSTMSLT